MPRIPTSDGLLLHVVDEGRGPAVVFVHGWMMDHRVFDRQASALAGDLRVVRFDLRGCGESGSRAGTHAVPRFAQDLADVLEHLHVDRCVLVGWSMGGGIVMEYAERFGWDRVAGVGLVDFPPRLREDPSVADKVCHTLAKRQAGFLRDFAGRMFLQPSQDDVERWVETGLRCTPEAACEMYRSMRASDAVASPGPYEAPAFLAFPERGWFRPALEEWKAIFPDHVAPPFSTSKHCPFWEEPTRFNDELRRFVRSVLDRS